MPLIYTARCDACGERRSAKEFSLAVHLDDGSLHWLRHPLETDDLARAGFTWRRASDEARLVRSYNLICRKCGGIYQHRVFAPPAGCLGAAMSALTTLIVFMAAVSTVVALLAPEPRHWRLPLSLLGLAMVAVAALWIVYRLDTAAHRRQVSRRPPLRDEPCCPAATARDLVIVSRAGGRRFPCPSCGAAARVRVIPEGIT